MRIKEFIGHHKKITVVVLLILWGVSLSFTILHYNKKMNENIPFNIEYVDETGKYNKIYTDQEFSDLKKENKELYDSLKKYKDEISYLLKFKYEKEYSTGIVHTKVVTDTVYVEQMAESMTYEYTNQPNDSFEYRLKINSEKEPNWYSLDARVRDEFTIVNKDDGNGSNHLTIESGGVINDVTAYKRKQKRGFWNRFSFGPGVTVGYDPVNKNYGFMVGATATFDLK